MGFSYLPFPIFIILVIASASVLIMYAKKSWETEPKMLLLGSLAIALSIIGSGVERLVVELGIIGEYFKVLQYTAIIIGIFGLLSVLIGAFQRLKGYPYKRKVMLIWIGVLIIIVFLTLLIAYWFSSHLS